jgi:predicted enzyme related to lactoylglutathione lyase
MHESVPNTIDHVEIPSKDLVAAKDLFTQLFGWPFHDHGPDYCASAMLMRQAKKRSKELSAFLENRRIILFSAHGRVT